MLLPPEKKRSEGSQPTRVREDIPPPDRDRPVLHPDITKDRGDSLAFKSQPCPGSLFLSPWPFDALLFGTHSSVELG